MGSTLKAHFIERKKVNKLVAPPMIWMLGAALLPQLQGHCVHRVMIQQHMVEEQQQRDISHNF